MKQSSLVPSLPRKHKSQTHNINCKSCSKSLSSRASNFFYIGHHLTSSEGKPTIQAAAAVFQCKEWILLCAGNVCTVSSKKNPRMWETRKHAAVSHVRLCTIKLQEVAFSSSSNHKTLLLFWDAPGLPFDLG